MLIIDGQVRQHMKVLVGIAELQASEAILSELRRFLRPAETEIRVLCVAEKVHPSMLELMGTTVGGVQRKEDLRASTTAAAAALDLRQTGFAAEGDIIEGDPKSRIVDYARSSGADLIVVGSEADGRLKKVLLGSVATAVVTNAHCPVLVIRVESLEQRP
jgi:nucleotide-binding universal stress UspA family protein